MAGGGLVIGARAVAVDLRGVALAGVEEVERDGQRPRVFVGDAADVPVPSTRGCRPLSRGSARRQASFRLRGAHRITERRQRDRRAAGRGDARGAFAGERDEAGSRGLDLYSLGDGRVAGFEGEQDFAARDPVEARHGEQPRRRPARADRCTATRERRVCAPNRGQRCESTSRGEAPIPCRTSALASGEASAFGSLDSWPGKICLSACRPRWRRPLSPSVGPEIAGASACPRPYLRCCRGCRQARSRGARRP